MYFYFSIQQVDQILHGTPEDGRPGDGHNAIGESVQREQSLHAPLASAADDNSKKNVVLLAVCLLFNLPFTH